MSTNKFIPRDALPAIIAALDAAAPPRLSLKEAVQAMASQIRAARRRGCSDAQILGILAEHGIKISASTLRAHLSGGKAGRPKPPRKGAAVEAAAALAVAAPDESAS